MDDFPDEFKPNASLQNKSYEVDYTSLTQSSVGKLMKEDIDHICGILGVEVSCFYAETLIVSLLSSAHCRSVALAPSGVEQGAPNREIYGDPYTNSRGCWCFYA